ncbi:primase-helicase family protein, partial [Streptococcus pyogenes]
VSNTGKGLLMHNILTPLFGYENVAVKRMEELESQFTEFMENKFIVFIDEIEAGKSLYHAKVTAKLKNLIVEPMISIRNMYRP